MTLRLDQVNQLGGFMRLGPQIYPARPNAVQVIERGPHGKRMAADPVMSRRGKPRGSGFRTWVEELNVPGNVSWNPPQTVVGLMGLGRPAGTALRRVYAAIKREGISSTQTICALGNQNAALFTSIALDVFPEKPDVRSGIMQLRGMLGVIKRGDMERLWDAQAVACLAREAGSVNGISPSDRAELSRLSSQIIVKKGEIREDVKPMISPEAVTPDGRPKLDMRTESDFYRESLGERIRQLMKGDLCTREQLAIPILGPLTCGAVGEPRAAFKNPLTTVLVVAGGAALIYGLATGIGSALVRG